MTEPYVSIEVMQYTESVYYDANGVEVTHRMVFCADAINICAKAARAKAKEVERRNHRCVRCKRPAEVCWVIRPI